jgi:hypothetical protein
MCLWARQARNIGSLVKGTTWMGPGEGWMGLAAFVLGVAGIMRIFDAILGVQRSPGCY